MIVAIIAKPTDDLNRLVRLEQPVFGLPPFQPMTNLHDDVDRRRQFVVKVGERIFNGRCDDGST